MNKVLALCMSVAVILIAGCTKPGEVTSNPTPNSQYTVRGDAGLIATITDNETGCQYIGYFGKAITPRMDKDGKQICISP